MAKTKKIIVSNHDLIPQHSKLSQKDKQELFDHYQVTSHELPKIMISDTMVQKLGAQVNDVIKITRKSPTAGETIFYRAVADE